MPGLGLFYLLKHKPPILKLSPDNAVMSKANRLLGVRLEADAMLVAKIGEM